ncbi:MAG: alanine racemase [Candidatus Vecturithrix sp.]|jgi:alanine racemase|nr:alanine racemase [Candidatus Vecturithrix sp.]
MNLYHRPAWIEINLRQLQQNFVSINQEKSAALSLLFVAKDQAYGHGAFECARVALEQGVKMLGVATISEAVELREKGVTAPILIFGECLEDQLEFCLQYELTIFVNTVQKATCYARYAAKWRKMPVVHVEIDTGLSRYGIRWTEAVEKIAQIMQIPGIRVEGIMSHFAMSDELDKSYALLQLQRFQEVLTGLKRKGITLPLAHICNTGGFLDLPQAHCDMVRTGILPLGVYPSQVCRRIAGIQPIMSIKAKIVVIRNLVPGDKVGYGMHYTAPSARRIAVIPLGYGDGFPRVRNTGCVLIHGKRAPIVGGNAMDVMMVDITDMPAAQISDEVVVMGKMGTEEIAVHEIARWKQSVSYDILTNWSWRLPRVYLS